MGVSWILINHKTKELIPLRRIRWNFLPREGELITYKNIAFQVIKVVYEFDKDRQYDNTLLDPRTPRAVVYFTALGRKKK